MKIASLALASLLFASAAHAQDMRGAYMGFSLGLFDYEEEFEGLGFSDTTTTYKILGGYKFSENFALEGGWGATSDLEDSFSETVIGFGTLTANVTGDYEVLTVRALGILPLSKVNLIGGVGYYDADLEVSVSVSGFGAIGTGTAEGSESGATLVGGLQFELSRVSIRTEIEWFDTDDEIEAWDASVGVLFRF